MSNSFKILAAVALVAVTAGCARQAPQDDVVFVQPAIQPEPTFNKF